MELLSRIDDIKVLSVMANIIDAATETNETLVATTSFIDATTSFIGTNNNYLQAVISSTVSYIENHLKSDCCDEFNKLRCNQALRKSSSVCTNIETFRTITRISLDTSIQLSSCWNFTVQSINDLNWERMKQLTSPTTSYDAIKYFTTHAGTGIHPCVVGEIVLKWWRVRTAAEHVDISFIAPLITTAHNFSSSWYYHVCQDKRYKSLIKALNIQ